MANCRIEGGAYCAFPTNRSQGCSGCQVLEGRSKNRPELTKRSDVVLPRTSKPTKGLLGSESKRN